MWKTEHDQWGTRRKHELRARSSITRRSFVSCLCLMFLHSQNELLDLRASVQALAVAPIRVRQNTWRPVVQGYHEHHGGLQWKGKGSGSKNALTKHILRTMRNSETMVSFLFRPRWPSCIASVFCFNVVAVFKGAFVYSILATSAWHSLTWEECAISAAILVGMGLAAWYNFRRRGSVTLVSQVWHERVLHRDSTKTRMGQGSVKELGDCDRGEDIQFSFLFALSNRHLRNGLVTGVCL